MNTKHLDYILAISETGSLSAASRLLGITQPVLSRYLARLEQELDTPVFVLKDRRYVLTEAGCIYLKGVQRIKHLQAQMNQSLDLARKIQVPDLSVGLPYYFDGSEFADIYTELQLRFPSLRLRLTEGTPKELQRELLEHRIDLLDTLYHPNWVSELKSAAYYRAEVLLVLPDDHPFAKLGGSDFNHPAFLTTRQFQSMGDQPFVLYHTSHPIGELSDELIWCYQLEWNIFFRIGSPAAVNSFLKTGTYGGLVLQSDAAHLEHMVFFHLPCPEYLYQGLLIREDHAMSSVEQNVLQLKCKYFRRHMPAYFYQNQATRRLIGAKE